MTEWTPSENCLADNGYPSDAELETIRIWPIENIERDCAAAFAYIEERWAYHDWGWRREARRRREWKGGRLYRKYSISTAGWSGNESIISAMEANWMLWSLTWHSSRRGGHYEFRLREKA